MTFLSDNLIRLRAVEPADADFMWTVESDSSQWEDNGMSAPFSRYNIEEYARRYDADPIRSGQLRLVVTLNQDGREGKPIGLLDLYDISALNRTALVGIYILPEYRGNGLALRALRLNEEFASRLLHLRVLGAKTSSANSASISLFTQAGFEKSGELTDWLLRGNGTSDLLIYTKRLES